LSKLRLTFAAGELGEREDAAVLEAEVLVDVAAVEELDISAGPRLLSNEAPRTRVRTIAARVAEARITFGAGANRKAR